MDLDTSKFASETKESEQESLAAYNEATASLNLAPETNSESSSTPKENGVEEDQHEEKETIENGKLFVLFKKLYLLLNLLSY